MIDLANQFGDVGAQEIFEAVGKPGRQQSDLLAAMADESVIRMTAAFKQATRNRRDSFLNTAFLSDAPFSDDGG